MPLRVTRSRTGWTPVSATAHLLARPLRSRGGLRPNFLGSVGAATRLCAAYGNRHPSPARPAGAGASPGAARRQALAPLLRIGSQRRESAFVEYKKGGYTVCGGEGSKPRGHVSRQAGDMGAAPGGTTGGASGAGAVRSKVRLCCGELTRPQRLKRRGWLHTSKPLRGNHLSPAICAGWGVFRLRSELSPPSNKRTAVLR